MDSVKFSDGGKGLSKEKIAVNTATNPQFLCIAGLK
jgi:hypothetical protein